MEHLIDNIVDDEVKHKKRKTKKSPKKSDHKHEYKIFTVNKDSIYSFSSGNIIYADVDKRCVICDKSVGGFQLITKEELENI